MPFVLQHRNETLIEWMDRHDCDQRLLFNTYRQFSRINRLLSGWKKIYEKHIRPEIERIHGKATILDVGCGGGDILFKLHQWCSSDGFDVQFTGIDPDSRSFSYLAELDWPDEVTFRQIDSNKLLNENKQFDIVISNHLMHHLNETDLWGLCSDADKLAKRLVLFSDIERSDTGYVLFSLAAPLLFRSSYIVVDGKISIRKSFRKQELQALMPKKWNVDRQFPFRLLAIRKKETQ
jgi:2-polyprenyl-3-methyl-5-hydroxy-6-metoxy-1,4-benzoquinol methylase